MIDAMVFFYAIAAKPRKADEELAMERMSSRTLIDSMELIRISAVTWAEITRRPNERERKEIEKLAGRIAVEAFDVRAAARAGELLRKLRAAEVLCDRCLTSKKPGGPCKVCGLTKSA